MWRIRLCFSRRCLIYVITSFVLAPPFDFTLCLASAGARVFYDEEDDDDNASEFNHQTRHCFHRQCVMFLLHKANHLVKGSRCRGGIVNIRFGCSRVLAKRSKKKKVFPPHIITCTTRLRHKSALSRVDACDAQKKRRRFAAGTRTLVDRGHYFHLKAGHDNHLHHSEPIRKWYDASFLACVTNFSRY